jgi:hypothetical protein
METFKKTVSEYISKQQELDLLNEQRNNILKQKKQYEEIIKIGLETIPQLSGFEKFSQNGSLITIKQPGTYNNPWHISKSELKDDLEKSWHLGINTPEDCYDFINEQVKRITISQNYSIEIKQVK